MNTAIWIITGLLAAVFALVGLMKIAQPKDKLAASGQAWVEDFPEGAVKAIGALEVLGAIGLLLPALLDTATVLVPLAATGLALMMAGAAITHARRGEYPNIAANAVLAALAISIAVERFGPYSF